MITQAKGGFRYCVEHVRGGNVIGVSDETNLLPVEGINYILTAALLGGAQSSQWYLAPFEGNYTPQSTDTAATLPASATECTAYDAATRPLITFGTAAGGVVDNVAAKTEITFNATKSVRGLFVTSAPTKGGTSGVAVSVVRFSSPKNVEAGDLLRFTTGAQITSA